MTAIEAMHFIAVVIAILGVTAIAVVVWHFIDVRRLKKKARLEVLWRERYIYSDGRKNSSYRQ